MKCIEPQKSLLLYLKKRLENEGLKVAFQEPLSVFKEIAAEEMKRDYKTGDVLRFVDRPVPEIAAFDKASSTIRIDDTGSIFFEITFYYFIESSDLDEVRDIRKRHGDEWFKVASYFDNIASQYPYEWDTEYDELIEDRISWTIPAEGIDELLSLIIKIRKTLTGKGVLSKDKRSQGNL